MEDCIFSHEYVLRIFTLSHVFVKMQTQDVCEAENQEYCIRVLACFDYSFKHVQPNLLNSPTSIK